MSATRDLPLPAFGDERDAARAALAFADALDLRGRGLAIDGHRDGLHARFEAVDLGELAFDRRFAALLATEFLHERGGEVVGADLGLFAGGGVGLKVRDRLRDFVLRAFEAGGRDGRATRRE